MGIDRPTDRRRLVTGLIRGLAAGTLVAMTLGGCAVLGIARPAPTGPHSSAPAPSPTAAVDRVRFTDAPNRSGMPDCAAVLPSGLSARLVPSIAPDDPVTEQRHIDPATMASVAAGGLVCNVDNGVAAMDSVYPGQHGDPVRNGIVATVLPDANDALDAFLSSDTWTGSPVSCSASDAARVSCSADVHAGSAWLHIALDRVQDADDATPGGLQDRFRALVTHATATVQDSALGTVTVAHEQGSPGPSVCVTTRVDAVTDTPLRDRWNATDWQDDISWVSLERAGGEWCDFHRADEQDSTAVAARYGTLPQGSWVVRARIDAGLVDADDRIDLDGLGAHDAAFRTCDDTLCTVDVVHDGDWTRYLLEKSVAPDTSAAVEAWARSSFGQ
ncbi:hypothetical protein [Curtobacterium sp. RRHDQ10]|uniref:hypothetical protein n=1 Tax=Curtobacterium phyllosphaerae TaxID=3413379 RepID=UPI003BF03CE1